MSLFIKGLLFLLHMTNSWVSDSCMSKTETQ